jgi:hypothetical protein
MHTFRNLSEWKHVPGGSSKTITVNKIEGRTRLRSVRAGVDVLVPGSARANLDEASSNHGQPSG